MYVDCVLGVTYSELLALTSAVSTINAVYGGTDILNNLESRLRDLSRAASNQHVALIDVHS